MRTLKNGMSGEEVRYLQYILKSKYGQNIATDSLFGVGTENTVKTVQRQLGLSADGSVGPLTQNAIGLSDYIVHIYDKVQFAGTPFNSKRAWGWVLKFRKYWHSYIQMSLTT